MAYTPETGHAKNVANFFRLIDLCVAHGSRYNPSKRSLTIASLQQAAQAARDALTDVSRKANNSRLAVNNRQELFAKLGPLSTRLVNYLQVTDATAKTVKDAKSINNKIQGNSSRKTNTESSQLTPDTSQLTPGTSQLTPSTSQLTPGTSQLTPSTSPLTPSTSPLTPSTSPLTPGTSQLTPGTSQLTPGTSQLTPGTLTSRTRSTSQRSYDQRTEHFQKLLFLLQSEPSYIPNEPELQTSTLDTYHQSLLAATSAVNQANRDTDNSRIERNKALYNPETGICTLAEQVKNYLKAIFGSDSPEFLQAQELSFNKSTDL